MNLSKSFLWNTLFSSLCMFIVTGTMNSQCVENLTPNSSILENGDQSLLLSWLPAGFEYEADLVFDSSVSGSSQSQVHNAIDGLTHTIVVGISEDGNIIGGYNEGAWSSNTEELTGLDNNFLFSMSLGMKFDAIPGEVHIWNRPGVGISFGKGTPQGSSLVAGDLAFASNANASVICRNDLGNGYECPLNTPEDCRLLLNEGQGWFNFNDRFSFERWEVWQLNTSGNPVVSGADSDGDGVCDSNEIAGCQDETACNYNTIATDDNGSCIYAVQNCETCSGNTDGTGIIVLNDIDGDGVCDSDEILGCQNTLACNYNPAATESGECILPDGCTDSNAINFSSLYTCDDGSCLYVGCTNPSASNYDPQADYDDGSCIGESGCTSAGACNFNVAAVLDDGSCNFPGVCQTCTGEQDGTGSIIPLDTDGDGVCDSYEILGCTDPLSNNYNPSATEEDNSCLYGNNYGIAGPDIENCHVTGANSIFNPQGVIPGGYTGIWTIQSGNASITFTTTSLPTPQVLIPSGQTVVLRLTLYLQGVEFSYDEMTCFNYAYPGTADAGADQENCNDGSFQMAANPTVYGSGEWMSDHASIVFADPSDPNTQVSGLPHGQSATLTWTLSNGICEDSDEVVITNHSPATQAVCQEDDSFCSGTLYTLTANSPVVGLGSWSTVSGPGSPLGSGASVLSSGNSEGTSTTYRYTITNGTCSSFDEVTITNDIHPGIANAGANEEFCGETALLNGNSPAVGFGEWTSTVGNVVVSDVNDPNTEVSGLNIGQSATLVWTLRNGACISNSNSVIIERNPGGCTDNTALNYNPSSICDDGSCQYADPGFGCTDSSACNYDSSAITDDGTCTYDFGCTDETAINFNTLASCDDGTCIYAGCMEEEDVNYNPSAVFDDGTCELYLNGCPGDFNADGIISAGDLSAFLTVFGTICQ